MGKTFSLALLCLLFGQLCRTQVVTDSSSLYEINDSLLIPGPDGHLVSAIMVRNKGIKTPVATILQFTIYARLTDVKKAKEAADSGYAGVVAYTRGKRLSPGKPAPYENDGEDVNIVIDWISRQPWSNGKVGMYGGSYNGFTQWAATKRLHPALKTIVPSAAVAPGLDVPMTNNVLMSFVFPWTYYVSNNKFLDETDYRGNHWHDLYWDWYREGRSYRALDTMIGRPGNEVFHRWQDHPSYDGYWQAMIPYKKEFATINIPVLTTTGYYDGGQIGALYYLREHNKYNPTAEHYLLIGPYGHYGSQGFPDTVYNNYRIDPVANIPIHSIIYQWFDHILRQGPRPAILKDRINYQVMGSNEWKHAPRIEAVADDTIRFHPGERQGGSVFMLDTSRPSGNEYIRQKVDLTDRASTNNYFFSNQLIYDSLSIDNGVLLISPPLKEELEFSGTFSGRLKVMTNKKDFDYCVVVFEKMTDGRYLYLTYFLGRASYAKDHSKRKLLQPGRMQTLPFVNTYMISRRLKKGSCLVVLLNVNKTPFEQINYGTGNDVSRETIHDAGDPLEIKWFKDSYIDIPVKRK